MRCVYGCACMKCVDMGSVYGCVRVYEVYMHGCVCMGCVCWCVCVCVLVVYA